LLYSKFEEEGADLQVEQPTRGWELHMDADLGFHKRPHNERMLLRAGGIRRVYVRFTQTRQTSSTSNLSEEGTLRSGSEQEGRKIAEEVRINTNSLVTISNGKTVEIEITPWDGKFREYVDFSLKCLPRLNRDSEIELTVLIIEPKALNCAPSPHHRFLLSSYPPLPPMGGPESTVIRALATSS
jgi:hypothetical protein